MRLCYISNQIKISTSLLASNQHTCCTIATLLPQRCTETMKDLKLLSPAAAAASAYTPQMICLNQLIYECIIIYNDNLHEHQTVVDMKAKVITAEAAAAATLRLTLGSTNLSLKAAASVRLSLALSRPSVMYMLTCRSWNKGS